MTSLVVGLEAGFEAAVPVVAHLRNGSLEV